MRKKFAPKAQGIKRVKPSRIQGSVGLPGGGDGQTAKAKVIPAAVDQEAGSIEEAEVDAVAVRKHRRCANIDLFEQLSASGEVLPDDRVGQNLSGGHLIVLADQDLLFTPVL